MTWAVPQASNLRNTSVSLPLRISICYSKLSSSSQKYTSSEELVSKITSSNPVNPVFNPFINPFKDPEHSPVDVRPHNSPPSSSKKALHRMPSEDKNKMQSILRQLQQCCLQRSPVHHMQILWRKTFAKHAESSISDEAAEKDGFSCKFGFHVKILFIK